VRGHYSLGRNVLACALARDRPAAPTPARARALNAAGNLASNQNDYESASSLFEQALAICSSCDDKWTLAWTLNNLGYLAHNRGNPTVARLRLEEALAINRELGDRVWEGHNLNNLGNAAGRQRDFGSARSFYEAALAIRRELGDSHGIAVTLLNFSGLVGMEGNHALQRSYCEEAASVYRTFGDVRRLVGVLAMLAEIDRHEGCYAAARTRLIECAGLVRQFHLAGLDMLDQAAHWASGIAAAAPTRTAIEGALRHAACLFGAVEALSGVSSSQYGAEEHQRDVTRVRETLGEEVFLATWGEGRAMTSESAIDYALEVLKALQAEPTDALAQGITVGQGLDRGHRVSSRAVRTQRGRGVGRPKEPSRGTPSAPAPETGRSRRRGLARRASPRAILPEAAPGRPPRCSHGPR